MSQKFSAGRRLDCLIAKHIFGWERKEQLLPGRERWVDENGERQFVPHYSTRMDAAQLVLDKLQLGDMTSPHEICVAALL